MKKLFPVCIVLVLILLHKVPVVRGLALHPQTLTVAGHTVRLKVPEGMRVEFLAAMDGPRFPALGPDGELLAGSRGGTVYRLRMPYTSVEHLVTIAGRVHSTAYRDGALYAAESAGLWAAPYSGADATLQPDDFSLVVPLPSETGGHWSRTVIVGPDQRLYIGIGISGNCSDEYLDGSYPFERRRGGVYVLEEGSGTPGLTPYSSGLRNPIGLAFDPGTGVLYATNAGPDNLGYSLPPEVFAALHPGSFHGMPWFQYYNGAFRSGECASSPPPRPAGEATPPSATFAARSTPQGVTFAVTKNAPPLFRGNALVTIHGSWAVAPGGGDETRRPPKIVMVRFADGEPAGVEDVVTGFQRTDGTRFARPSGIITGPDGNIYFTSDDGEVTGLFRLSPVAVAPSNSLLLRDEQ